MFLFPLNIFSQEIQEKLKIVARDDPIYSFQAQGKDKYHFNSENETQYVGADFEIMQTILNKLEIPYSLKIIPYYEIYGKLFSGEADIGLGLKKTKKNMEVANFPKTPMQTHNYVLYGRKDEAQGSILTFEDILGHNYNLGISMNLLYPKSFWDKFPYEDNVLNNHLTEFNSYQEALFLLVQKKINVFVGNKDLVNSILTRFKQKELIIQYKKIVFWQDFFCAFSKNSKLKNAQELQLKIWKAIYQMQETNQLNEINSKWIQKNPQY